MRLIISSLTFLLLSIFNAFSFVYDGFNYTVIDENTKTCRTATGYYVNGIGIKNWNPGNSFSGDLVLPEKVYNGDIEYTLVEIGNYGFSNEDITSIVLPPSITKIGDYAFALTKISTLDIPEGVTSIGEGAFNKIPELQDVKLPKSLKIIGKAAFAYDSSLQSFIIPGGVITIGAGAFDRSSNISSIVLEEGNELVTIASDAFPSTIKEFYIGKNWVCSSSSLSAFKNAQNVDFGTMVTEIPQYAFYQNSELTTIQIPNSVTNIGVSAFNKCTSLNNIRIGNKVSFIGDYAFSNIGTISEVVIEDGVDLLSFKGSSVFGSTSITNLYIGRDWDYSGSSSIFPNAYNVIIGDKVSSIPRYAFNNNKYLTTIVLPNNIINIGERAFYGCNVIYSVTIGKGCTSIGANAFTGCTTLTSVTSLSQIPPSILGKTFESSTTANGRLIVPFGSKNRYQTSDYWLEFLDVIELEETGGGNGTPGTVYEDIEFIYMIPDESKDFSELVESEATALTWTSSNDDIAEVNKKGRVDAWGFGRCYITAKNADDETIAVFEVFICPTVKVNYGTDKTYEHHVIYNSTPSLYIAAPDGYEIDSVSHDGEDVTEAVKANEGYYTPASPITDNTVISVNLNSTAAPGDLNGDGKVDSSDLNWLLEQMMNF